MDPIPIKAYERITKICELALAKKTLGVIYGLAGTGKSVAVTAFKERHDGRAILLRADPCLSMKEMLRELCETLEQPQHGTMRGLERRVINALNSQKNRQVLLVDEADRLGRGDPLYWFEILRTLYDMCEGLSLVLAGEEGLMETLERSRHRESLRRFYSRITVRCATSARQQGKWVLMTADDARLVVAEYALGELEDTALRRLVAIGQEGGMRKLCNTAENLQAVKREDAKISAALVRAAEGVLGF